MSQQLPTFPPANPYRPGAGHPPPFLAGRDRSKAKFASLLSQTPVLKNLILTGLRGVGKTVLLDHLRQIAVERGWAWTTNAMSESACVSEEMMAVRVLADLSMVTAPLAVQRPVDAPGFGGVRQEFVPLHFGGLTSLHAGLPGLAADKLVGVLRVAWVALASAGAKGLVFAYDEAQNLSDRAREDQFPMSVLLDAFSRLQREGFPFLLVLTGLPTLQGRLVEARTYSERMFTIDVLSRLTPDESRDAILKPLESPDYPKLTPESVETVVDVSSGYPYFIQFICKDVYDVFAQQRVHGQELSVPLGEILRRLDADFYAGRWALVSDRERELLGLIANLKSCETEFTMQQIEELAGELGRRAGDKSTVNRLLKHLCEIGLVYKVRHGRYTFGVPLLGQFIRRQAVTP